MLEFDFACSPKIPSVAAMDYPFTLYHLEIPKIWRRALVVAIPKPRKSSQDPKTYRLNSLLCIPFKIVERLIYTRIEPIIDSLPPWKKVRFRHWRSTVEQVAFRSDHSYDQRY